MIFCSDKFNGFPKSNRFLQKWLGLFIINMLNERKLV